MNFFSTNKMIIWILTVSLIITLSILGSLIYHMKAEPEGLSVRPGCSGSCVMLFDELDLDKGQQEKLEDILDHFSESSDSLISNLRQYRLALMMELQSDDPDSLLILSMSEELGAYQALMTKQAVSQYMKIKAICNHEQRQRLTNIYCDLFGCSRINMGQGQHQYQYRNHKGRN